MALTDVKIRAAKLGEKAYRLADTGGLYLLIPPSGRKLWRWNYRYGGKQKTMPFGKYPDVSLADARTAHQAARAQLREGNDPMAQRKADRCAVKAKPSRNKLRLKRQVTRAPLRRSRSNGMKSDLRVSMSTRLLISFAA